ncbi:hypothetical protein, partial [Tenacibaculum maritimum]|uniref:hypothetical protein n=1 Tax=Tenacibaculum maritimum TaxID=107401 RepID=UPI0038777336
MEIAKNKSFTLFQKGKDNFIDALKENEVIFFKKKYEKAIYKISTAPLERITNKRISLNTDRIQKYQKTYPFIENIKNIYLKENDTILKRDLSVKKIIDFLTDVYNKELKKEIKKDKYQKYKKDISVNLYFYLYE